MSSSPLLPDLQAALERLFHLFSDYVAAGNARQRRKVHTEILDLFSHLGVVSDSPLVRQAVELFDHIKEEPVYPISREMTLANEARDFVNSRLRVLERGPSALSLSAGARQLFDLKSRPSIGQLWATLSPVSSETRIRANQ